MEVTYLTSAIVLVSQFSITNCDLSASAALMNSAIWLCLVSTVGLSILLPALYGFSCKTLEIIVHWTGIANKSLGAAPAPGQAVDCHTIIPKKSDIVFLQAGCVEQKLFFFVCVWFLRLTKGLCFQSRTVEMCSEEGTHFVWGNFLF